VIRAFDLETGYQLCQGGSFAPQVAIERILIEAGGARGIALRDGRTVTRPAIHRLDHRRAADIRDIDRPRTMPAAFAATLDNFQYTGLDLIRMHLALQFAAVASVPNTNRTLNGASAPTRWMSSSLRMKTCWRRARYAR